MPANEPFVIHCFVPAMCQPPSLRVAVVTSAPASDPAPGSVSANAPIVSPRASGGTNRARCSSLPNASSGSVQAEVCTATVTPTPASARDSSSSTSTYERKSAPGAAVLLGHAHAEQPELGQPPEQRRRERVRPVPLGRVRRDLGGGELARERLDLALIRRELEVHAAEPRPGLFVCHVRATTSLRPFQP